MDRFVSTKTGSQTHILTGSRSWRHRTLLYLQAAACLVEARDPFAHVCEAARQNCGFVGGGLA